MKAQCVQYSISVFSLLGLGHILMSDLVVAELFMHSLSCMIQLYLAMPSFILKVFLHEITQLSNNLLVKQKHVCYFAFVIM